MFVITQTGKAGETMYLADRSRIKDKWWVDNPAAAMQWEYKQAAIAKRNTLLYGDNKVVDTETGEEF